MSIGNERELEFGDSAEENEAAEREFFEKMKLVFHSLSDFYTENKQGCGSRSSFQDVGGNLVTLLSVAFAGDFESYNRMKTTVQDFQETCVKRIGYFQKYRELLKDPEILLKERTAEGGAFPTFKREAAYKALKLEQTPNLMYIDLMWKEKFGSSDN